MPDKSAMPEWESVLGLRQPQRRLWSQSLADHRNRKFLWALQEFVRGSGMSGLAAALDRDLLRQGLDIFLRDKACNVLLRSSGDEKSLGELSTSLTHCIVSL